MVHLLNAREIVKLTCDKLCRLLEMGKYEVGQNVEACKQEHTDLQETQKERNNEMVLDIFLPG